MTHNAYAVGSCLWRRSVLDL